MTPLESLAGAISHEMFQAMYESPEMRRVIAAAIDGMNTRRPLSSHEQADVIADALRNYWLFGSPTETEQA